MNKQFIISALKKAFSEELQAFYAYFIGQFFVTGKNFKTLEEDVRNYALDELLDHADKLMNRIAELDGTPDDLATLSQCMEFSQNRVAPITFGVCQVPKFVYLNIEAEKAAITTYTELALIAKAEGDIVTEQIAKDILADEEEHLKSLNDYWDSLSEDERAFANPVVESEQKAQE